MIGYLLFTTLTTYVSGIVLDKFNQKIQNIIKEKNENLIKISNTLNNVQLIKKQYKKTDGEKKFINKFINVDK